MKPCECKDHEDLVELECNGIVINDWGIEVLPGTVRIRNLTTAIKLPMDYFKRFAEWYLEDQLKGDE